MNLYRITQDETGGYDTYDSAIVAAETEDDAKCINPGDSNWEGYTWARSPDNVDAILIGTAVEGTEIGVILASFNAG